MVTNILQQKYKKIALLAAKLNDVEQSEDLVKKIAQELRSEVSEFSPELKEILRQNDLTDLQKKFREIVKLGCKAVPYMSGETPGYTTYADRCRTDLINALKALPDDLTQYLRDEE